MKRRSYLWEDLGKGISSMWSSTYKGPGVGAGLVCLSCCQEVTVAGEGEGEQVREEMGNQVIGPGRPQDCRDLFLGQQNSLLEEL